MTQDRLIILVVAMANSIHVARWLNAQRGAPFRFVLLPASVEKPSPTFAAVQPVSDAAEAAALAPDVVGLWDSAPASFEAEPPDPLPPPIEYTDRISLVRKGQIVAAVEALHPVLVHSMEIQHAGYACLGAAELMGDAFPRWLVSNWGSDLQLYRKLPHHQPILTRLMRRIDACLCECRRDQRIARELGYGGPLYDPLPASGGFDFTALARLPPQIETSQRRDILIKGYHGWSGRALHVLSAIHLAAPALRGFRIRLMLARGSTREMAAMLRARDGLDVVVDDYEPSHDAALARIAASRMTIGIGISDGIGTTTLEAMALGSFPIAGCSSCVDEWIRPGRDGFIVDPHDVAGLADCIVRAAQDDRLVDEAARRNLVEVETRWNERINAFLAAQLYRHMLD